MNSHPTNKFERRQIELKKKAKPPKARRVKKKEDEDGEDVLSLDIQE
jgi:hypothetical protein